MKKKIVKEVVKMSVAEYVEKHNKECSDKITRHDVYPMIRSGKLKATKGKYNAWVIELEVEKEVETKPSNKKTTRKGKKYSVKEFVDAYNDRHPVHVTCVEVRKLLADGVVKGEKVDRKWVVYASPSRRIK